MPFLTALSPSLMASLICVRVCLFGPLIRSETDIGCWHFSMKVYLLSPCKYININTLITHTTLICKYNLVHKWMPPPLQKKYMEECALRTQMPPLPAKVNRYFFFKSRGHNSRTEKLVKTEIKLSFSSMVPDPVYKFQMIFLKGSFKLLSGGHKKEKKRTMCIGGMLHPQFIFSTIRLLAWTWVWL